MATNSEQVHLMVPKVKFKKRDGILYLMSQRLTWGMPSKDHFEVSQHYSDIKCQKVSPEGKAKVQLQIVMHSNESNTFQFCQETTEECKKNRNAVKEILSEMLPRFRRTVDKELEEKNRLLQEDPELLQMYKDLVVTEVITPEEFWKSHSQKLTHTLNGATAQKVGISASFLSEVKPQTDACNGLRYNLTPDTVESIFRTFPSVKKKYMDKVPDKLSEKEFWTMFFQSHYFHRDRTNQSSSKDIFSDCSKIDDQDIINLILHGTKDPLVDLTRMEDADMTTGEGYGSTSTVNLANDPKTKLSNTQIMNKNIIKRFNHQNAMVLNSISSSETSVVNGNLQNGNNNNEDEPTNKKSRILESIIFDDLQTEREDDDGALNLIKSERYSHGPTILKEVHQQLNSHNVQEALQIVYNQSKYYKPKLNQVLTSNSASAVLLELYSGNTKNNSNNSDHQDVLNHILPEALGNQLRLLYASANELLAHFWLCFPVNTPFRQEKIVRMFNSLNNFHQSRINQFKDELLRNRADVNVVLHLEEMFNNAYIKYNNWQSKRTGRK